MAEHSSIEWTDATWNPVTGCSVISPGCTNCYAMKLAGTRLKYHWSRIGLTRDAKAGPVWTGEVRFNAEWLTQPLLWKRSRKIFVCAHGDLFADGVPDEWVDRVFAVMALAPWHTFQVLTKRADRLRAYFEARRTGDPWAEAADYIADLLGAEEHPAVLEPEDIPLPNVWLGVSVEDQQRADERREDLDALAAAGWTTFVSFEPALGAVDWTGWEFLSWLISGGENGPRPSHPDWHRAARDFCAARGIAYLFKQWGSWMPADGWYADHPVSLPLRAWGGSAWREVRGDDEDYVARIGKKAAGRLLDGREHNGMPGGAA